MGKDDKEIHMRHKIETERADLFDTCMIISMLVRINIDVPYGKLQEAFTKACLLHEVLNSKVVIEPSGEAFYKSCEEQHNSFTETDLTFTELINSNEGKRFRLEEGEFIRGFRSPDGLVFMMHHLGGDGKSLLYFIETFMRCLNGEECSYVPFRNLTVDNIPEESELSGPYELLLKYWNKKWKKEKRVFTFDDMDAAYKCYWKDRKTETLIDRYEKKDLELLLGKAKEAGVTLTSYLITDMIKESGKESDVGLAVDGRTDSNRSMGNQATGIAFKYKYNDKITFAENAIKIQNLMKRKLTEKKRFYLVLLFMGKLDPTLVDSLSLEHAGYFSGKTSNKVAELLGYGSKVKDISLTNLTRADIPVEYGPYKITEITFVPPVVSYGKNIIGIVTANDTMTIARHYIQP